VLASLAAGRTQALLASGAPSPVALTGGYAAAFVVGALFATAAALLSALLLRAGRQPQAQPPAEAVALPAKAIDA